MRVVGILVLGSSLLLTAVGCGGKSEGVPGWLLRDADLDGLADAFDNCPDVPNLDQDDNDNDGIGNACDEGTDTDGDGVNDELDNCARLPNADQGDGDGDGVGDVCDNCPTTANPDQNDADANGTGDVCVCEGCLESELCLQRVGQQEVCVADCPEERACSDECCPLGSTCNAGTGSCEGADLVPDGPRALETVAFETLDFAADACEVVQQCVLASGSRRVMRFEARIGNIGPGALALGPYGPEFGYYELNTCFNAPNGIPYVSGLVNYNLADSDGTVLVSHSVGICVEDTEQVDATAGEAFYTCGSQGISAGYTDIFTTEFPCQWLDVTDVAPGTYALTITLNETGLLAESDTSNNSVTVDVVVPAP